MILNNIDNGEDIKPAKMLSKRGADWMRFALTVMDHVESYTVPQYGDKGEDLVTEQTCEECVNQVKKYLSRFGRNSREGQQELDFLKAAHYIQMAYEKYTTEQEK
jgi:hypothetical protein